MVTDALTALDDAISGVRRLDFDVMTDGEVEQVAYGTIRARVSLLIVSAEATRRWERSGQWSGDGSKSPAARMARDVNCSLLEARRELRFGRALASMPHTAAAVAVAEIGRHTSSC